MGHLAESTVVRGHTEHHPVMAWLIGAASALFGFVLVEVVPIMALLFTAVVIAGLLGLSALPSLRDRRQLLFAIGLGLAIPVAMYFGLAAAQR